MHNFFEMLFAIFMTENMFVFAKKEKDETPQKSVCHSSSFVSDGIADKNEQIK